MAHTFEQEQQTFHKKIETDSAVKLRFFDISSGDSLLFEAFNPSESRALKLRALETLCPECGGTGSVLLPRVRFRLWQWLKDRWLWLRWMTWQ